MVMRLLVNIPVPIKFSVAKFLYRKTSLSYGFGCKDNDLHGIKIWDLKQAQMKVKYMIREG